MNDQSLWNPMFQETFKRMDPEKRYKAQKMFGALYDKTISSDPQTINMEVATQIKLMLRDGLHPDLLDENEKEIYKNTFGQNSLDEFYVDEKQLSQKMIHQKSKKEKRHTSTELSPKLSPKRLKF